MTPFLVLRLEGPLMAFGDVAVDEIRPSDVLPGASLLTGLFGNALGWRYTDQDRLQGLQDRLRFAVRLDRAGQPLVDYQTAEIAKNDLLWRVSEPGFVKRKGDSYDGPVQRYRHYRADAQVSVVVTLLHLNEAPTLDDLADALARPARPLFLGRYNCPPSGPIHRGERVEAESPQAALTQVRPMDRADKPPFLAEWPAREADLTGGWRVEGGRVMERQDRRDWLNDIHSGWRWVVRGNVGLTGEDA